MYDILIDPFVIGFVEIPALTIFLCAMANWRLENTRLVTGMCFLFCAIPAFGNIGLLILTAIYTFIGFLSAFFTLKIKKIIEKRKGTKFKQEAEQK